MTIVSLSSIDNVGISSEVPKLLYLGRGVWNVLNDQPVARCRVASDVTIRPFEMGGGLSCLCERFMI
jgi:hypothetical protein